MFNYKQDYQNSICYRWINSDFKRDIQEAAMNTVRKSFEESKEMTPLLLWKYLISEHSPIRNGILYTKFIEIYYPTSVHFARHVHSIPFVSTSREDRTGVARSLDTPVNHDFQGNLQNFIDIARKRLCIGCVSPDTYRVMASLKMKMMQDDDNYFKVIGEALVPNCIYRGLCPEFKKCGFLQKTCNKMSLEDFMNVDKRYEQYNSQFVKNFDNSVVKSIKKGS